MPQDKCSINHAFFSNMIVVLVFFSLDIISLSATYYVDPGGNDHNDGRIGTPFATIQKAIDEAEDGTSINYDVVYINSGNYTTDPIILNNDNQRIEFAPSVVVQAKSAKDSNNADSFRNPFAVLFKVSDRSNVTFKGDGTIFQLRRDEYPPIVNFDIEDVNLIFDQIMIENHGLKNGDAIRYYYYTGSALEPLIKYRWYYVIIVDADRIQLASSFRNATDKKKINLTSKPALSATHMFHGGEWRHIILVSGSNNIEISGITCRDSGGDGIQVQYNNKLIPKHCRDIKFSNVICDNNFRYGISVTGADGLLIEDCVIKNTNGAPAPIGVNFEFPRGGVLLNAVVRNCLVENNVRTGINLSAGNLDKRTPYISLLVEDCNVVGAMGSYCCVAVQEIRENGPRGVIKFKNTTMKRARYPVVIKNKASQNASVVFENCTISDVNGTQASRNNPIQICDGGRVKKNGGIRFVNCQIFDNENRPAIKVSGDPSDLYEIHGELYIQNTTRTGNWYDWGNSELHKVDLSFYPGVIGGDGSDAGDAVN